MEMDARTQHERGASGTFPAPTENAKMITERSALT
jgi:hypothetical protein